MADLEKQIDEALEKAWYFDNGQIRAFVKQVKDRVGPGWKMLGKDIQRALIAEEAMRVLISQAKGTSMPRETTRKLYVDMCRVAGVLPEGEG